MRKTSFLLLAAVPFLSATAFSQNLIFDNGPLITHPGLGFGGADVSELQNTTLGLTVYGFGAQHTPPTIDNSLADDFHSCGMTIDEFEFFAYQTGSSTTSTITGAYVKVYNADPSTGAAPIWGDHVTNIMSSTTWSRIYRTLESSGYLTSNRPIMSVKAKVSPPLALPPGRHWVHAQFSGTLSSGPWVPPITVLGDPKTGNGLQRLTSGAWGPMNSGAAQPQGMPFRIYGQSGLSASATLYGAGKAGTAGVPTWTPQVPYSGIENYKLEIINGFAGSAPFVILGGGRANIPFLPFGTILVNPAGLVTFFMPPFVGTTSTFIFDLPELCTGPLNLQAFFVDPGAVANIAHTDGLELFIGN